MQLNIKVGEENNEQSVSPEQARDNFAAVISAYKVENPAKYEIKKDALAAQLAKLEAACPKSKKEEEDEEEEKPKVAKEFKTKK